jgi:DNA-binding transcriptional ArsR family regulator
MASTAIRVSRLKTWRKTAEKSAVETILDETARREVRRKARTATLAALRALGGQARREAIKEQAVAIGDFSPHELSAVTEERSGRQVRIVDQHLSWALSDLKREGLVENPERGIWRLTSAALRLDELRQMPYDEYLKTPEWERTRAEALARADHCCALNLTHTEGLDVLHRTKERVGRELPSDLVVLCKPCHDLHQEQESDAPPPPRVGSIPPPVPHLVAAPAPPDPAAERKPRLLRRLRAS